jgi:hypothetical protein
MLKTKPPIICHIVELSGLDVIDTNCHISGSISTGTAPTSMPAPVLIKAIFVIYDFYLI